MHDEKSTSQLFFPAEELREHTYKFGRGGVGKTEFSYLLRKYRIQAPPPKGNWIEFWTGKLMNEDPNNRLPRGFPKPVRLSWVQRTLAQEIAKREAILQQL
jgi:hypothetical protein